MEREASMLKVDLQIFIEKLGDTKQIRYKSKIIGWQRDAVVIVSIPTINGATLNWNPGQESLIKFISGGHVFAFQSSLIKALFQPIPMLFFRYPKKIENVTLRKHNRIQTFIVCSLHVLSKDDIGKKLNSKSEIQKAIILDLSLNGAFLEFSNSTTTLRPGDTLLINFKLPNGAPLQHLPAKIKNVREDELKTKIGIQFSTTDSEQLEAMDSFFKNHTEQ